ncbi:25861c26-2114-481d-b35f-3da481b28d10 [Sclerotinia trifoliorum]|uniref:25861c26-2114-481d-b35f-3da481b28d10 n=1 Tax=Sclerotinia trifoliorum TaxID=28548 RepID=A0A8H2W3Q1_9HELO|nr:25861c26-2114-481d-b35f-3da481b28d10 [Sclerotinia trifoliorum]
MTLSKILRFLPNIFGTIFILLGINAVIRPSHALTFYQPFSFPKNASDAALVEALMTIYGARDIFMGLAMYIASYYRNYKILGWVVMAGSAVAFVDGWVCYRAGGGEGDHWAYAPVHMTVGVLLVLGF